MIGPVIAFLHDLADIGIAWTRSWAESEYKKMAGYSFAVTLAAWFYTRILVLPQLIYAATIKIEVYVYSPYV